MKDVIMDGFVEMSKYAGMREDLVQAGGGNSSCKPEKNRMVIKASGYQLADVTEDYGYAVVDPEIIAKAFLESADISKMTEKDSEKALKEAYIEGERPSIETFLHAVSGKYTLHTHPVTVNALACRKGGMAVLKELFPDALIVPYATPGIELAKVYFKEYMENGKEAPVVFLQNHGMVVSGEDAGYVMDKTEQIVKTLERYLSVDYGHYHNATLLYHVTGGIVWNVTDKNVCDAYKLMGTAWENSFCPDCVVFLGKKVCVARDDFSRKDLEEFTALYGKPVVFEFRGALYINAESVRKALEIQSVLSFSAQVMQLNRGYECNLLSGSEQNFLLNWDAEKYRKSIKQG